MRIAPLALLFLVACPTVVPPPQPQSEGEGEGEEGEGEEGEGEEGEGEEGEGEEGEGEEGEGEEGEGEGEEGEGEGEAVDDAAVAVVQASRLPGQIVDDGLRLLWEVVSVASTEVQEVRTFGTVDLRGAGSYSPQPANQLVYLDDGGVDVRFTVGRFEGDFNQSSAREFYLHDHDVIVGIAIAADDTDFDARSDLADSDGSRGGVGVSGGDAFEFTATVDVTLDVVNDTADFVSVEDRAGSVGGLAFTDSARYHVFLGQNVVEDLTNDLTVTGTFAGATWSMTDGRIQRTFRNGRGVQPDFWGGTSGDLLRDGAEVGFLAARDAGAAFEIVFVQPGPQRVEVLEVHAR